MPVRRSAPHAAPFAAHDDPFAAHTAASGARHDESIRRARPAGLRRTLLQAGVLAGLGTLRPAVAADAPKLEVWKDPSCGCCHDWIAHMTRAGFAVTARDAGNTAARARAGIAARYGSCHTGFVAGYAIEGHVPAADVKRLLAQRPDAIGLAVPGMPIGSPGMDGPEYGGRRDRYEVLLLGRDGGATVFSRYG